MDAPVVAVSSDGREQAGMGVDAADYDGDGLEDLSVGAGRTGRLTIFHNTGTRLQRSTVITPPAAGDLTTILGSGGELIAGVASLASRRATMR